MCCIFRKLSRELKETDEYNIYTQMQLVYANHKPVNQSMYIS